MRASIHSGAPRPQLTEFVSLLKSSLEGNGIEVIDSDGGEPDVFLAVGGDGTMLGAVKRAVDADVPVLGFNLGTLGFLTQADPADVHGVAKRLAHGDYEIQPRMTIHAAAPDGSGFGVNDVVVEKVDSTRLIALEVAVDGEPFATYAADGLIVATPTGSTGYAFSAGGPIVDPSLAALILAPVAPHSLFNRSLVLPAAAEIRVQVVRDRPVRLYADKTDLGVMKEGESAVIGRGPRDAKFINLRSSGYPSLVREKFGLT